MREKEEHTTLKQRQEEEAERERREANNNKVKLSGGSVVRGGFTPYRPELLQNTTAVKKPGGTMMDN
ncbi:hypothetical protein PBY51_001077 [Eleginops maclovinus]|uniref:Uncharacterized protein n=1 Tax=Eleginops maclovinus TaxID=56733 RepID=A0AAN7XL54_ELEMC|nr:hypothetical protein PBY51_001077 [Eleginops maclovinus]